MELTQTMEAKEFKYDVAFSFLKEDLELAQALSDRLSDRLSTFIYTDRQHEVIATEAMESFRKVYGEEARIVVVLYRPKWGQTNYTRIEEDALRGRSFISGPDFILLVKLEPGRPAWYSESIIYCDYEKTGLERTIGYIESLVMRRGGVVRPETIEDLAARQKRELDRVQKFRALYRSTEGVKLAQATVDSLLHKYDTKMKALKGQPPFLGGTSREDGRYLLHMLQPIGLSFEWTCTAINSLDEARLTVEIGNGQRFLRTAFPGDHRSIAKKQYKFAQDRTCNYGWQLAMGSVEFISSDALLESWMKRLLELHHNHMITVERKEIR